MISGVIAKLLYPERCVFCGCAVTPGQGVCRDCAKDVKMLEGRRCRMCALPEKLCSCGGRARFYDAATAPFLYKGVVRDGIRRWKFKSSGEGTRVFASAMARRIAADYPGERFDFICRVPGTAEDMKKREFDPTLELASELSELLRIPLSEALVKTYPNPKQHSLPMYARTGNVFGAFDCVKSFGGRRVLLIDDILTTGSTMNECAKMLALQGAESVKCAAVAAQALRKAEK